MLGLAPAGFGIIGGAWPVVRWLDGNGFDPMLFAVAITAICIGGYVVYLLWPRFQWVEVRDNGICIKYKSETTEIDWHLLDRIEHFAQAENDGIHSTLVFFTTPNEGHLLDAVTVHEFESLVGDVQIRAVAKGVKWVEVQSRTEPAG